MTVSCVTGLLPEVVYPKRQVLQDLAFLVLHTASPQPHDTNTQERRLPWADGGCNCKI
jgi:hypothetical protein